MISESLVEFVSGIMEEPTKSLRWSKGGKLQQAFSIRRTDRNGYVVTQGYEWRDVPTEGD